MFESIWADIKWKYQSGNMLIRIIMVNVAFWLVVLLAGIFVKGIAPPETYDAFRHFWMISTDWVHNLTHPWVIFTHMFFHEDFWHIFWNMLLLYWFGNLVGDMLGDRIVLPTYLLSGLVGGAIYFIVGNLPLGWEIGAYALGASAAVNGFMVLAASKFPDYEMNLILIGPVKIKWIVGVFIAIDVIALSGNQNSGGHFAHLGGAAMGWYIVYLWNNKNIDLIGWANAQIDKVTGFFSKLFSPGQNVPSRSKIKFNFDEKQSRKPPFYSSQNKQSNGNNQNDLTHQERLDLILDKIKASGYDNLTKEEKDFLYQASKK